MRIFGLEEKAGENCPEEVVNFCNKELVVGITGNDIVRVHRVGRKGTDESKARAMIVKFKFYAIKRRILKSKSKLRGRNIFIDEELNFPYCKTNFSITRLLLVFSSIFCHVFCVFRES